MERLVKNNDVILDGTEPRYAKEKRAFTKLEELEDTLEKYAIRNNEELDRRLEADIRDFTYLEYGKYSVKQVMDILRIIKDKQVDIKTLMLCLNTPIVDIETMEESPKHQLEMYNLAVRDNSSFVPNCNRMLTMEEFDILKEWLK